MEEAINDKRELEKEMEGGKKEWARLFFTEKKLKKLTVKIQKRTKEFERVDKEVSMCMGTPKGKAFSRIEAESTFFANSFNRKSVGQAQCR